MKKFLAGLIIGFMVGGPPAAVFASTKWSGHVHNSPLDDATPHVTKILIEGHRCYVWKKRLNQHQTWSGLTCDWSKQ